MTDLTSSTVDTNSGNIPNTSITFDSLVKEARKLGAEKAHGDDSLAKFFIRMVAASVEGVIDLTKNKHGEGVDDAHYLYSEFSGSRSKKAIHERTANGLKAQVSKARTAIHLGSGTQWDAMNVIDRAVEFHKTLSETGAKMKPAYVAYVDVARTQISKDAELTDDEIKECLVKASKEDPTVEGILRSIQKKLEGLITGEVGVKDSDERTENAFNLIRERLSLATLVEKQKELALLQEQYEATKR